MLKSAAARFTAFVLLLFFPASLLAQDVNLLSRDGSISITGNFLSFDGEFYRVDTDLGVLTVDSSGVRCEGPGCPALDGYFAQIRISGEPKAMRRLMPALITAFAMRNGYAVATNVLSETRRSLVLTDAAGDLTLGEFILNENSNAEGFADLMAEDADMVLSLRKVTPRELALASESGTGDLSDPLRARVVALDALVPIVSRSNLINALSLADLGDVYSGRYSNWSELGGSDAPIAAHLMREDLNEDSKFRRLVLGAETELPDGLVTLHDSYTDLAYAIEDDPYALGFGRLSVGGSVKRLGLSGACGFEAQAVAADIKTEDYPLTRPVFLYTPARRLPTLAREFQSFILSPAAQLVLARTDFVDQGIDALSFRDQGRRFANAIATAGEETTLEDLKAVIAALQGAERLTLGFRFQDGSTTLDAQSRSNVHLLSELIEAGVFDDDMLLFAGFSDGQGAADINRRLSKRRAETVLRAVRHSLGDAFAADRISLDAVGFGEAMPLACDDVSWGRSLNRRVEVWIRPQR